MPLTPPPAGSGPPLTSMLPVKVLVVYLTEILPPPPAPFSPELEEAPLATIIPLPENTTERILMLPPAPPPPPDGMLPFARILPDTSIVPFEFIITSPPPLPPELPPPPLPMVSGSVPLP